MPRAVHLAALTAFLQMFGLSVLFPVLPFYVRSLHLSEVQAGALMSAYAAASVLASPMWGRFSERRGRRPAIVIGLLGFAAGFAWFGAGNGFAELLAARIAGGLIAAASLPAIFALVADATAPSQRSVAMGWVGAAIGLGLIGGPVFGGLLSPLGLRVPFFAAAAVGVLAAAAVAVWLPESNPASRAAARPAAAHDRRGLRPYLAVAFLFSASRMGFEATFGFLVGDRLGGGPRQVGAALGGLALVGVLVQGGGMRYLAKRTRDEQLIVAGAVFSALALAGLGVTFDWAMLVGSGALLALGYAVSTPAFNAHLSRYAEHFQGEAQGLSNSAQSLGRVVGPLLFTALYQHAGASLSYAGAAALSGLAGVVAARSLKSSPVNLAAPIQ